MWTLFGIDYLVRLVLVPSRSRWFLHHLPDLTATISPVLRLLKFPRLVTLVNITQCNASTVLRGRTTLYAVDSAALPTFTSVLAVLEVGRHESGFSIRSFGQALWWMLTTLSTASYGDPVPVFTQGCFIAALLMTGGVVLTGAVTATLASWIVSLAGEENTRQEVVMQAQAAALQQQVSELSRCINRLLEERGLGR